MELYKYIIFLGLLLILIGFFLFIFKDNLYWFGNLYGDFKYESKNLNVYFPLMSMVLVSFVISLVLIIINKFSDN